MQAGNTGLPKGKKRGTLSHLLLVFIFSFSFLGRGVSVPTLQMRESALPQAAPAVCLTRGAVSGRMDFLNLSSCILYPHLLFCFPLATFANSSRYISPLSLPLTFSPPCSSPIYYPHHPLSLHLPLSPILLLSPALPDLHPGHPTPGPSPPVPHCFAQAPACAWGEGWAPHALGLCWVVGSQGLVASTAGFMGGGIVPFPTCQHGFSWGKSRVLDFSGFSCLLWADRRFGRLLKIQRTGVVLT